MIGTCQRCGNYHWDKQVEKDTITCPKCGYRWKFRKLPLFILTGCSGIGKTTTGIALQKQTDECIVLDADMFYNIMPHETEADDFSQIEQIESLSKNICQSGKTVLWTMAGNIDKLTKTYHKRFFSTISVLALICDEDSLRTRMTEGRNIQDADWIQSSVDYNHYFKTHDKIGDVSYDVLNIEGMAVEMVADQVYRWVCRKRKDM